VAKDLLIRLEAKDNASAVFQRTGRAGADMGKEIEQGAERADAALDELNRTTDETGQSAVDMVLDVDRASDTLGRDLPQGAERGERALDELDRAQDEVGRSAVEMSRDVESSGRSLRDLGDAGQQVGAGLALLGTSFAMYSSQLVENQRQVSLLQRIYGDAAGGLQAFAEQIQKTTTYSSESAVAAANALGTLTLNYGVGVDKIRELMTISTDLAATSGLTLEDTASRVAAAVRGETEAAEWLNLTLNQQAIDIDGVTLSMSNQEAGLYRINALTEQATFAQGAAAEQAQTTAGHFKQLANSTNDTVRSFVEFTGPVGQAAGVISSFGLEAGLALSGTVALAKGMRELTSTAGGAGAAIRLLASSPALGFAALAAGAGLAVIAVRDVARSFDDNYYQSISQAIAQTAELDATVLALIGTMNNATMGLEYQGNVDTINATVEALSGVQDKIWELQQLRDDAFAQGYLGVPSEEDQQRLQELEAEIAALEAQYGDLIPAQQAAAEAQQAYQTILANTAPGAEAARETASNLFDAYERGEITIQQLRDQLNGVIADFPNYTTQALEAQSATEQATEATTDYADAQANLRSEINLTTVAIGEYLSAQNPGQAAGALFIENAKQIEEVLRIIETAMADGVANSPYDLFGGQAAFEQLQSDLMAIQTSTEAGAGVVRIWADQLTEAFLAGRLTADEYANGIRELSERSDEFAAQAAIMAWEMEHNSVTAQQFADAMGIVSYNLGEGSGALETTSKDAARFAKQFEHASDVLAMQFLPNLLAVLALMPETEERSLTYKLNIESDPTGGRPVARPEADALSGAAQAADIFNRRATETATVIAEIGTLVNASVLPWQAYEDALRGVVDEFGLLTTNAQQFQAAGLGGQSVDVAVNLQMGGDDLGRIFNTIVGQTNQMSQQLGQVDSWADKLIGDPGTWSQLDQLLADGRISLEQYTAAQEAQVRISTDVENAQQDLLAVQANLAPVIADATRQQAEYIDSLQDMDTQSQLAALGFMDQAESARALEIAQLAAASSTEGQRDATTQMIQEMVNADPVLGAMLEKMGLISIGADGTVTVNFDDAVNANESIDNLTASIEDLTALLGDIFNIDTDTDAPESQRLIEELTGAVNAIPDKVTTYIEVVDNASYQAQLAREALALLDGYTVTTYINTVQTGSVKAPGLATGGTIPFEAQPVLRGVPAFAGGGTLALVGDGGGPELVRLPTGAQVYSAPATRSMLATAGRNGGEGAVIINGPVTLQPAGSDAYGAIRRAALSRARGY